MFLLLLSLLLLFVRKREIHWSAPSREAAMRWAPSLWFFAIEASPRLCATTLRILSQISPWKDPAGWKISRPPKTKISEETCSTKHSLRFKTEKAMKKTCLLHWKPVWWSHISLKSESAILRSMVYVLWWFCQMLLSKNLQRGSEILNFIGKSHGFGHKHLNSIRKFQICFCTWWTRQTCWNFNVLFPH